MKNLKNELLKSFSKGIAGAIGFIFILGIVGISYAAFERFSDLQAGANTELTSTKWNNLVDAVKDDYKLNEETLTSKTWLGKPVYRKVIQLTSVGDAGWRNKAHGISNLERVIDVDYTLKNTNGYYLTDSTSHYNGTGDNILVYVNTTYISYYLYLDPNASNVYVTVEYTKTTDIAE